MRVIALAFVLAGCAAAPAPPQILEPDMPRFCPAQAALPKPPPADRSILQLLAWARTAAMVANAAIKERDRCALEYQRLRAAVLAAEGRK